MDIILRFKDLFYYRCLQDRDPGLRSVTEDHYYGKRE
jgi:hypothetical protein